MECNGGDMLQETDRHNLEKNRGSRLCSLSGNWGRRNQAKVAFSNLQIENLVTGFNGHEYKLLLEFEHDCPHRRDKVSFSVVYMLTLSSF